MAAAPQDRLRAALPEVADAFDDEDSRVSAALREAAVAEPEELQAPPSSSTACKLALWAVLRSATFEDALCLVVNMGDDADTVGAITGALAGAVYGEAAHPRALARAAGAARALARRRRPPRRPRRRLSSPAQVVSRLPSR